MFVIENVNKELCKAKCVLNNKKVHMVQERVGSFELKHCQLCAKFFFARTIIKQNFFLYPNVNYINNR